MSWKSIISVCIAVAGIAAFNHGEAQTNSRAMPPSPTGREGRIQADDPIERLGQELKLTTAQKNKVQSVFQETRAKIQNAVQEAMTNADNQLQRILTPEQYQKMQSLEHPRTRAQDHSAPDQSDSSGKSPGSAK